MSYLYDILCRYGDVYPLKSMVNVGHVLKSLELYKNDWVQYNPRKNIDRQGLSITSLDGGLSGVPDLDSVKDYNIKNNLNLSESSFNQKTELWPLVEDALKPFEDHLGRTHFIRMSSGGYFPPHRDQFDREVTVCRLFIPIINCNPPNNYFILDEKIINFEHGRLYFINTCKEHTVFTTLNQSIFVVVNITITEESVDKILNNLMIT